MLLLLDFSAEIIISPVSAFANTTEHLNASVLSKASAHSSSERY